MAAIAKPNDGEVTGTNGDEFKIRRYTCDSMAEAVTLLGTVKPAGGYVASYKYGPRGDAGSYIDFEATTSDTKKPGAGFEDGEQDDFCEATTFPRDLATHPDYKISWDHKLFQFYSESGPTVPAWWQTATDNSTAETEGYRFAKDDPGDRWMLVKDETKPDVTDWLDAAPIVTSFYYHRNKATASAQLKTVGKLLAPPELFGYTGLQWLVVDSRIAWNGRKYEVVTRYQGAPEWDSDIYSA